ncbi:LPS export ABC transporter periplasmic protein LptC [Sansalvadorimonas verongulae]|uniref:LPS export ABC transporter periplasmic protein LptC n=1 Tax=Sansalvadorimonas verongulae TaxID=2172824 RepID=UPI0012BC3819|nr:LPS export ABC transporter periplasmic protein LptC [Sansalvadorimonas verongulae]MTI14841.1 LPS export ABC transporter periplasmic protein LptC [Sansalvadorimonas verongulae]
MSLRQIFFTALALGFIGMIGFWSYTADNPNTIANKPAAAQNKAPDFFVRNARVTEFGPEGELESVLVSDEISHFPHNDTTLLKNPDLLSYNGDPQVTGKQPWHTTADSGRVLPDGETVELIDNVVMVQRDAQGNPAQRVDTDFMTVYSGQEFAESNLPVRLTTPTSVVNAVGMRAFYKRDFIQLKSRVRSIHETR